MEFKIQATVQVKLSHKEGAKTSQLIHSDFSLNVDSKLNQRQYLERGNPTAEGCKMLTVAFIQGMVGNIHYAHEKGYRDSAEHLRYVISELERFFAAPADISNSTFDEL